MSRSPRHRQRTPCGHKRMNRFDALTRVLSDMPISYTQRSPSLELLRERGFTAPRDTSLCESMFGRMVVPRQLLFNKEKIHKRAVCLLGTCVTWLPMPYAVPEDHICPCLPGTKLARGFILARLHDSIEMNAEYQVGTLLARISGSNHVLIALLLRRHSELRSVVIWVPDFVFEIQEWRGLYSLGALVHASQSVPSDFDLVACGGSSWMSSPSTGTPSPRVPDFVFGIQEWRG